MQFKLVSRFLVFCLTIVAIVIGGGDVSLAQQGGNAPSRVSPNARAVCDDGGDGGISGILSPISQDSYSVYVQLAKKGEKAQVTLYAESIEENVCGVVGSAEVNGDSWSKIGDWTLSGSPEEGGKFVLVGDQIETPTDANRPTVMLISNSHPACNPSPSCQVTVNGQEGVVGPISNSIAANTLRVTRVVAPDVDTVVRVVYYVDERPVYSTKQLEAFDYRYVVYRQQKAVSVIEYASGQRVVIDQEIPATHNDNFFNFLFRVYKANPTIIITAFWTFIAWLVVVVSLSILHLFQRRYYWRLAHGLVKQKNPDQPQAAVNYEQYLHREHFRRFASRIVWGAGIIILFVVVSVGFNQYIATLYRIDGPSMASTYLNGDEVVVNRLPVTMAHINRKDFIPNRGDVVILRASYGYVEPKRATDKDYIVKRVIGLPGERVTIIDGAVMVYARDGKVLTPDKNSSWEATMQPTDQVGTTDITLAENELFVFGDNRPESIDSRFNGAIRTNQVVGIVSLKLF